MDTSISFPDIEDRICTFQMHRKPQWPGKFQEMAWPTILPPSLSESASNKNDKKKKNDDLTFYH